jgi:hypothetical protein
MFFFVLFCFFSSFFGLRVATAMVSPLKKTCQFEQYYLNINLLMWCDQKNIQS